ncbi:hypothetical protein ACJX0J_036661, partial [Zea mays]
QSNPFLMDFGLVCQHLIKEKEGIVSQCSIFITSIGIESCKDLATLYKKSLIEYYTARPVTQAQVGMRRFNVSFLLYLAACMQSVHFFSDPFLLLESRYTHLPDSIIVQFGGKDRERKKEVSLSDGILDPVTEISFFLYTGVWFFLNLRRQPLNKQAVEQALVAV